MAFDGFAITGQVQQVGDLAEGHTCGCFIPHSRPPMPALRARPSHSHSLPSFVDMTKTRQPMTVA